MRHRDMGTGEAGTSMKVSKASPSAEQQPKAAKSAQPQEQPPNPGNYTEWAAAFQAYYNPSGQAPPGYFPPPVVSGPQPHPYMWGGQPMMTPYGAPPPPYGAVYPHGSMYAHPSMAVGTHPYQQFGMPSASAPCEPAATQATPVAGEQEVGRELRSLKTSKRSLGSFTMLPGRGAIGKGNSGSANGVFSQSSVESGSDGSNGASEEDNSPNNQQKRDYEPAPADGDGGIGGAETLAYNLHTGVNYVNRNGGVAEGQPTGGPQANISVKAPSGPHPTTNLGIGIQDYWSASNPGAVPGGKGGKRASTSASSGMDEREVKRQRRKQSNRESARRSRLRKQAECEELGARVDTLNMENVALRNELKNLTEDCRKMKADHTSLLEQLRKYQEEEEKNAPSFENGVDKQETTSAQAESNGTAEEKSSISNSRSHGGRREEISDSSAKVSSALDSGSRPETVGAG